MTAPSDDRPKSILEEIAEALTNCRDVLKSQIDSGSGWATDEVEAADLVLPKLEKLKEFIEFVKHAPVSSGVCCCGMPMDDTHPEPMDCGHTPTDQWHYQLHLWLEELSVSETHTVGDGFEENKAPGKTPTGLELEEDN